MKHTAQQILVMAAFSGAMIGPLAAQPKAQWPPLPMFDLKEYTLPEERKFVEKEVAPYYQFTEKDVKELSPERLWRVPGLGSEALTLLDSKNVRGLFALAPGRANPQGKGYTILGLNKVGNQSLSSNQVFYRVDGTGDRFHSPQFSPDGAIVVVREGLPPDDRYNGINLFLWNMKAGKLRFVPSQAFLLRQPKTYGKGLSIMLPDLKWSPGSRFLSYMRGGNTFGDYDPRSDSYHLSVLDTPSRRDHLVMKDAGLSWSWTYQGTLLCSLVPPAQAYKVLYRNARPSVYEADALGGKPRKLFDGGYYAHESPDGQWIAFCDWPGPLFDATNPSKELQENTQRGLFLFHKPSGRRAFVGELELSEAAYPFDAPLMQWSPDGQTLYVTEMQDGKTRGSTVGQLYRMTLEQQQLQPLVRLEMQPRSGAGVFRGRGISPDGSTLYLETRQAISGPKGYPNRQFTLLGINTATGEQTPLASLKNIASENPDWDWHDTSGTNPAFAAAQKREEKLPAIAKP